MARRAAETIGLLCAALVAEAQPPVFIQLDAEGFEMVLDETRDQLYISVPDADEILTVSLASGALSSRSVGAKPTGIDVSLDGQLLVAALNGSSSVAYLDLDTLDLSTVVLGEELGDDRTYDVMEGKPNRVFVSANPGSTGSSYIAMIKRDENNAVSRVAGDFSQPTGRTIRAAPVFERSPDQLSLYIGEGFSPNSLFKLDLTTDSAPIVLKNAHGAVDRTDRLAVSPDGSRIHLGSGQVLQTSDFVQIGAVADGIPRFNAAGDLVYVARQRTPFLLPSPIDVHVFETSDFTPVGPTVELPCFYLVLRDFELLDDGEGFLVLGDDNLCGQLPHRPHDVSITLLDSPDPVALGATVTYTGTVKNEGTLGVTGISATLTLPPGMAFVSSSGAHCSVTASVVSCDLGALAPGASAGFAVEATAIYTGDLVAAASVTINEGDEVSFNSFAYQYTTVTVPGCTELLDDGSFEAGIPNPFWNEFSLNFGTPLCTTFSCGTGGGTSLPRTGAVWSWFGGVSDALEAGTVSQSVLLPPGNTRLQFHLWSGANSGNGQDFLMASIDGTLVFVTLEGNPSYTGSYQLVSVDIPGFADGGTHLLSFDSNTFGPEVTNFSLDDVSVQSCPPPVLSIGPGSVTEGDESTSDVSFDLLLSAPSPNPVSVPFSTFDGTATAGSDYLPASGTLSIPQGATGATISVAILGDYVFEDDETFTVELGAPTGAILMVPPNAAGTILNDDAPGLTIGDVTVAEPTSGHISATFAVELSPPEATTVTVHYATLGGSATVGDGDYTAVSGQLTFPPRVTTQTFDVPVLADGVPEGPETFTVELSTAVGSTIARSVATGHIAPPGFFTLVPCRLTDTRLPVSQLNGPALEAGKDRVFLVAGNCGVPASAKAISLNIAVTGSMAPGNVRLHPGGSPVPPTSTINFLAGQTRSNNAIVPLDALGRLAAFLSPSSGTAHLIIDVNGYFQ